jgi:hypothetical protein
MANIPTSQNNPTLLDEAIQTTFRSVNRSKSTSGIEVVKTHQALRV